MACALCEGALTCLHADGRAPAREAQDDDDDEADDTDDEADDAGGAGLHDEGVPPPQLQPPAFKFVPGHLQRAFVPACPVHAAVGRHMF